MTWTRKSIIRFTVLISLLWLVGCAGQQAMQEEEAPAQEAVVMPDTAGTAQRVADSLAQVQNRIEEQRRMEAARLEEERRQVRLLEEQDKSSLQTIYFDYDKASLSGSQKNALQANAELLMKYPNWSIVIEGHCDERGSTEYNLALGERRAATVQQYYVDYGVASGSIRIISYGEEKPVEAGHNENAWSKNRRAETRIN